METFLIITAVVGTTLGLSPPGGRIVGGTTASPGQFPFIVSLNNPAELCGASIINKNWVVTAAHCIDFLTNGYVLDGTTFQHSGGARHDIAQIIRHENYTFPIIKNDIALVQIEGEFEFGDLVQRVEIGDVEENATCVALGWGSVEDGSYPEELMFVELRAMGLEECQKMDPDVGEEQVCADGSGGKGVCGGDSGGPLVCGGKLVGIVSYGLGPCGVGADVYTRASAYVEWIKQHIS